VQHDHLGLSSHRASVNLGRGDRVAFQRFVFQHLAGVEDVGCRHN